MDVVNLAVVVPEEDVVRNKMARVVSMSWKCLRKTWIENKLVRCG